MYAIYVRDLTGGRTQDVEPLAVDIDSFGLARTLVMHIAHSYPEHGVIPGTSGYWFRGNGRHSEIWCEASANGHRTDAAATPGAASGRIVTGAAATGGRRFGRAAPSPMSRPRRAA